MSTIVVSDDSDADDEFWRSVHLQTDGNGKINANPNEAVDQQNTTPGFVAGSKQTRGRSPPTMANLDETPKTKKQRVANATSTTATATPTPTLVATRKIVDADLPHGWRVLYTANKPYFYEPSNPMGRTWTRPTEPSKTANAPVVMKPVTINVNTKANATPMATVTATAIVTVAKVQPVRPKQHRPSLSASIAASKKVARTRTSRTKAKATLKQRVSQASSSAKSPPESIVVSDDVDDDTFGMEAEQVIQSTVVQSMFFGTLATNIVGVQHYRDGVIAKGEYALLKRDPYNRYDKNAIAVCNQASKQLGHIPAKNGLAGLLAPFIDKNPEIYFEAITGLKSQFTMPIELKFYGPASMQQKMKAFGIRLRSLRDVDFHTPADAAAAAARTSHVQAKLVPKATVVSEEILIEKHLEDLFNQGMRYESMAEATPKNVVTELMEHQKKGLWWMQMMETSRTADQVLASQPPEQQAKGNVGLFRRVESNGQRLWANSFTGHLSQSVRLPRGGILADDMGLGKTLQILATIATAAETPAVAGEMNRCTLIVCPMSVMNNWITQASQHTPSLKLTSYYGPDRTAKDWGASGFDVVLTTYAIMAREFYAVPKDDATTKTEEGTTAAKKKKKKAPKAFSKPMYERGWGRIVFDEAHNLRNANTKQAKAAFELKCLGPMWLVTGTPIQNQINDLFPLVRLLKVQPFVEFQFFRNRISQPLKLGGDEGITNLRLLVGNITLRRIKGLVVKDKTSGLERQLVELPQKSTKIVKIQTTNESRTLYDNLFKQSQSRARAMFVDGKPDFMNILQLLGRLRSLCCDARLLKPEIVDKLMNNDDVVSAADVIKTAKEQLGTEKVMEILAKLKEYAEDECVICLESGGNCITRCTHVYHRACIEKALLTAPACPLCRADVKQADLIEYVEASEVAAAEEKGSTTLPADFVGEKIRYLIDYVTNSAPTTDKIVVFSSFTRFLDLIASALIANGHPVLHLDGRMSAKKRKLSLDEFSQDASKRIMLCSLKAAGVGLNLVMANHLLLMDPWWNPAAEEQAIDRIYRIGQTKPVSVIRLLIEGSIEEKMLSLANDKKQMYEGALEKKSQAELRNIRWQMMSSIFEE
eukprot:m.91480 g.91480  ORF g.91480 m.91480 type:complete len:1104 (+) comp26474_c0_seq1:162-3473(+)